MKKFKKLKQLSDTGKLTTSIPSMDNISTLKKKPNSLKKETMKPKFTDRMKLTNFL